MMDTQVYLHPIPTLFSGYDVDPLLKKEVFTVKNQVLPKCPEKKRVFGVGSRCCNHLL